MRRFLALAKLFFSSAELASRGRYGEQYRKRLQFAAEEWSQAKQETHGSAVRDRTRYFRACDELRKAAIEYAIYDGRPQATP